MKHRWLIWVVATGVGAGAAVGDVLDEMGVDAAVMGRAISMFDHPQEVQSKVLGLPISEAHAAEIVAEMQKVLPWRVRDFNEQQGKFEAVLASSKEATLDRVRLLVRLGRGDEAKAEAAKIDFQDQNWFQLKAACRPLEDSEDWDALAEFFQIVAGATDEALWLRGVWAEELDVAWHRGLWEEILREAAGNPLRLAVFHDFLGNTEERDRLEAELLKDAPSEQLMRLCDFIPESAAARAACLAEWRRDDLPENLRPGFLRVMLRMKQPAIVAAAISEWLAKGGDPAPLVDVLWNRQSGGGSNALPAVVEDLHRRFPDDARVSWLWVRGNWQTSRTEAVGIFQKLASLPVKVSPDKVSYGVPLDMNWVSNRVIEDMALLGMLGLGEMNRQDLVAKAIAGQPSWAELTLTDRLQYLAAGDMDREFVAEILAADFANEENASLCEWLTTILRGRLIKREMPKDVAEAIAGKFAEIAAGNPEKRAISAASHASALIALVGGEDIPVALWENGRAQLRATFAQRYPDELGMLDQRMSVAASTKLRVAGVFPMAEGHDPQDSEQAREFQKANRLGELLRLFYPPGILRVAGVFQRSPFGPPMRPEMQAEMGRGLPLSRLERWSDLYSSFRPQISPMNLTEPEQAQFRALMRCFEPGSPRRIFAEAMVAAGQIECGDEAMEMAAKDGTASLLAGKKEARGSESFRMAVFLRERNHDRRRKHFDAIFQEIKAQPPVVQQKFRQQMESLLGRFPDASEAMKAAFPREVRGGEIARANVPEGIELLDVRRLTPAAVVVAVRMLGEAGIVDIPAVQPNYLSDAIAVLRAAGEFEAWRAKEEEKRRLAGEPPVKFLRWLKAFDRQAGAADMDYDRLIFELEPRDRVAAQNVASSAAAAKDQPLLLAALRAMDSEMPKVLSAKNVFAAFSKQDAPELLELVRINDPHSASSSIGELAQLHEHFLKLDPVQAAAFRDWLAIDPLIFSELRDALAMQLFDAHRDQEAVDTVVRAFLTPTKYPGIPHQFPPKTFRAHDTTKLQEIVGLLKSRELLGQVADRLQAPAAVNPVLRASLVLVAHPDLETLEREVLPAAVFLESYDWRSALDGWREISEIAQVSDEVQVRLMAAQADRPHENLATFAFPLLVQASDRSGGQAVMATLWKKIRAVLDEKTDTNLSSLASASRTFLTPMLRAADDATWRDYWSWRKTDPEPLLRYTGASIPWRTRPPFCDPARLRQVLPRMLKEEKDEPWTSLKAGEWALSAAASNDAEIIRSVRARIPDALEDAMKWKDLCDLAVGDSKTIFPQLDMRTKADGTTRIAWNLVTLASANHKSEVRDVPSMSFHTLDGKFEANLVGGPRLESLTAVKVIEWAAIRGHVSVKLADDQKLVCMLATDQESGDIRLAPPREVPAAEIGIFDAVTRGLQERVGAGPGGSSAWILRGSQKNPTELISQEWHGTEVSVEGWTVMDGDLELRCIDGTGKVTKIFSVSGFTPGQPLWRHFTLGGEEKLPIPPGTVRLVLAAWSAQEQESRVQFSIADVRMQIEPLPSLPDGFQRLVRVPGQTVTLTVSPDGKQLAAGSKSGKWVIVDLASGAMTELPFPAVPMESPDAIRKVVWTAQGFFTVTNSGELSRVDLESGNHERILDLWDDDAQALPFTLKVSPDGKWFAWQDTNQRLSLAAANDRVRRNFLRSENFEFEFDADGLRLTSADGTVSQLATQDFLAGKPALVDGTPVARRIRFDGESVPEEFSGIQIAVAREAADIGADGAVYFVDGFGNVVRVGP